VFLRLGKSIRPVSSAVNIVGIAGVFFMMAMVTVDVIMRYMFHSPINGAMEISEMLLVLVVFLGLAAVQSEEGHVRVTLVVLRFNNRTQLILGIVMTLLALCFFALMVWRSSDTAISAWQAGSEFQDLEITTFPIRLVVPLGVCFLCLELLLKLVLDINKLVKGGGTS